ncbi:6,7-dimethyl-8-ribityllumazine synthase, partial [Globisporangium splendens]
MATTHADRTHHDPQMTFKPVLVEEPGAIALPKLDGSGLHVGIVYTRQSQEAVDALVTACRAELLFKGVPRSNIHELQVSLPFEIPYALKRMLQAAPGRHFFDVVVCIGCMVKGETLGFEFVAEAVTRANMKLGMKMKTPVINGVLTCTDANQAHMCSGLSGDKTRSCNFGVEFAQSAIEMAHFNRNAMCAMVAHCKCECHGCKEEKKECSCACGCEKCESSAKGCGCSDCQQSQCQQGHEGSKDQASGSKNSVAESTQHSLQKSECGECGCMGSSKSK